MTRINVVPPSELIREHLIAEYRELPRMFDMIHKNAGTYRKDIPSEYTLGTGHMKFFLDKAVFLVKRQRSLIEEMQRRGYKPNFTDPEKFLDGLPKRLLQDWTPTEKAMRINRERIADRIASPVSTHNKESKK